MVALNQVLVFVTAVATAATAAFTLWLIYFVRKQWQSDALYREHLELIKPDVREALRTVFSAKSNEFLVREDMRLRDAAERVLDLYDLIGHRLRARSIPHKETIEAEWPTVLRVAQKLKKFIIQSRLERGTDYKEGFQYLVTQVIRSRTVAAKVKGRLRGPNEWPVWRRLSIKPAIGFRNPRPCVAVSIVSGNKVLLLQRAHDPGKGLWELPGGFLNDCEHPLDAAVREIQEETGLAICNCVQGRILMGRYVSATSDYSTLNICCRAELDPIEHSSPEPRPKLSDETMDFKWCPLSWKIDKIRDEYPLAFAWMSMAIRDIKESRRLCVT